MSRGLVAAALAFALAVTACGGDGGSNTDPNALCNDFTPTATSVANKAGPCNTTGAPITIPTPQQCTTAVAQCNEADRRLLRSFLDCLNALPTCSLPTATTFLDRLNACTTPLSGLTAACASATGAGG